MTEAYEMGSEELAISEAVYDAIQTWNSTSARGQQSENFVIGMSDLGFCSERLRRTLEQEVPEPRDMTKAFYGQAIGDWIEQSMCRVWPDAIRQAEVNTTLVGERHTYTITGHPDLIRPVGLVLDVKTCASIENVRRTGPSQQQQFQRHLYGQGVYEAGLFECGLDEVMVGNIWLSRSGDERPFVQMEPFSTQIIDEATWWLDEAVYAYLNKQTARKEPPREMCIRQCGYAPTCRALDTDVSGLLTDPAVLASIDMYTEGMALERTGKKLKKEGKEGLEGISGSNGAVQVRWTWVNGVEVHSFRSGYNKLSIVKVKREERDERR